MKSYLLFDGKTNLQNDFVAMKLVLWVISSPDVKLNLLPQSSQWNPTCSLIQNYSSKWLCGDNSSLVSNFKTRCLIEPFAAVFTMKSCLLFDSKLLFKTTLWWWNWMSNWSFFRCSHNEILFALWLKTTLQNGFVVIIQVLWVISVI